jgi:sugar phosphate isomerase/epimerase
MKIISENNRVNRRQLLKSTAAGYGALLASSSAQANSFDESNASTEESFALKYMLASCMYGYMYVGEILPEVAKCGGMHLDLWPKKHGNQREQLTDLGEVKFAEMLTKHSVSLGCITQYALGPFRLTKEFELARRFGCQLIVTGGEGPTGLAGAELRSAVGTFVERMKPHLDAAEENNVTIAIENHANNLFETADSLKYLRDLSPSKYLKIGLAPYHLPQDSEALATLISDLGPCIAMFYAWQHGNGCMTRLPKEEELLQLPGRGSLDFTPLLKALQEIQYQGWIEIFMHPVPRGIPIHETADEVTNEINRSRAYLADCLRKIGRV